MINLETLRTEKKAEILHLAEVHGARNVRVFGSVARGDNGEDAMSISWWTWTRAELCSISSDSGWTSRTFCIYPWRS